MTARLKLVPPDAVPGCVWQVAYGCAGEGLCGKRAGRDMVEDPIETLVDRGRVVFTAAPPGLEGVRRIVAEKAARSTAYVPRRRKESRAAQALACQGMVEITSGYVRITDLGRKALR